MDQIFAAVADGTRRQLLDRLRARGPQSLTELSRDVPMSRQAVTKHLEVLADAGLVRARRHGRERIHELAPDPLRAVDDWLAPYAAEWDRRLAALRSHLGEDSAEEEETEEVPK